MALGKMTYVQRWLAFLFSAALLLFEIRDIQIDKTKQEKASSENLRTILADNRDKTAKILERDQAQFATTESDFSALMEDDESMADLSSKNFTAATEALNNITGGGGYIYVGPRIGADKSVKLTIWNSGKYRISNIDVTLRQIEPKPANAGVVALGAGSVNGHAWGDLVSDYQQSLEKIPNQKLWLLIDIQTGMESELLEFRSGKKSKWEYRIDVEHVRLPTTAEDQGDPAYHDGVVYRRPWTAIGDQK